jgi:23S rRNA (guanosine2251-2'-O)-methyltransferase
MVAMSHKNPPFSGSGGRNNRFSPSKSSFTAPQSAPSKRRGISDSLPLGQEVLYGYNVVKEVLLNPKRKILRLLVSEAQKLDKLPPLPDDLTPEMIPLHKLEALLPSESVHQGIMVVACTLEMPSLEDILATESAPLLILDQVTDPHNIGAILRSCAAFGVKGVIVQERCSPAVSGLIAKTASGGTEHVPLIPVTNLSRTLEACAKAGYWCIGLAGETEQSLTSLKIPEKAVFVLGAEGSGLRRMVREHCDILVHIPMSGQIESLNVSNAAAVTLFEYFRQHTLQNI